MCGLAGFVDRSLRRSKETLEAQLAAMTDSIRHRGPDDQGAWIDSTAGIALGHRRLSILDLSAEGHQPMHSHSGRSVIVFNGEIYNFQDLRRDLESLGHRFRGHSDTEIMLAAFEQWGLETSIQRFNGMFAFALWDRRERLLHLCRDRIGKKPLYYGWAGKTFLFASELKAFHAHSDFQPVINRDVIALYLRHGYIPAPYSIYEGVYKVPAGAYLTIRPQDTGANAGPTPYWSVAEAVEKGLANPICEEARLREELRALLQNAVELRMIADVPLGAFLSGGIDSSLVVALMQLSSSRPVKTFSIGFLESSHDEAHYAKAVAEHLGTDHTELYVTPAEARNVIPRLADIFDEPFADSSQIPTFLVSELARRHVTVSLSGDGGDELFAGYSTYESCLQQFDRYDRMPALIRRGAAAALRTVPRPMWDGVSAPFGMPNGGARLHRLASVLSRENPEMAYMAMISHWEFPSRIVPNASEPPTPFTDPAHHGRTPGRVPTMMYLDTAVYLPDDILVKVDRASMAVSLEARCPLLDYRLVEFAWRVPFEFKRRDGIGKWVLRQILYDLVPPTLIERPKSGFSVPIGAWLRGPLRDWAEELLAPRRLNNDQLLNPAPVRQAWAEHLAGQADWSARLWDVLMFNAWLDRYKHVTPACTASAQAG